MLRDGEALAAPVLLLAMFAGSLIIGLRALSPVEHSRRRQLEFTADASHELRTPLSVINAEIGIALSAPREAADYRAALLRIQGESGRLRRIVEDLLWLARFDSAAAAARRGAARPGHHRRRVRPPVPGGGPGQLPRGLGDGRPVAGRLDQRAAGMDRPAHRGTGRQRLPLRGPGRERAAERRRPRRPGQPDRGGQRAGDPAGDSGTGCSTGSTGPPSRAAATGLGPGHRRLDRAVHRWPLADRRVRAGRRPVRGVLAPPAVPRPRQHAGAAGTGPAGPAGRPGPAAAAGTRGAAGSRQPACPASGAAARRPGRAARARTGCSGAPAGRGRGRAAARPATGPCRSRPTRPGW